MKYTTHNFNALEIWIPVSTLHTVYTISSRSLLPWVFMLTIILEAISSDMSIGVQTSCLWMKIWQWMPFKKGEQYNGNFVLPFGNGLIRHMGNNDATLPHSPSFDVTVPNNQWFHSPLGGVAAKVVIFNILRPRQDGRHFPDDIFKCIFLNENVWISLTISLKCVRKVRINNIPLLVQIMAWRRPGDKPLSEPMMVSLLTHICVTRPRWVKHRHISVKFSSDECHGTLQRND